MSSVGDRLVRLRVCMGFCEWKKRRRREKWIFPVFRFEGWFGKFLDVTKPHFGTMHKNARKTPPPFVQFSQTWRNLQKGACNLFCFVIQLSCGWKPRKKSVPLLTVLFRRSQSTKKVERAQQCKARRGWTSKQSNHYKGGEEMPLAYAVALCWIGAFLGAGVIGFAWEAICVFINRKKSGWYNKK